MKLSSRVIGVLTLFVGALLGSCEPLVYEYLEECPQGAYVSFYTQTRCQAEPVAVGEVDGLYLFAFDVNDVLAHVHKVEGKVDLTKSYKIALPPVKDNQYVIMAWAGLTDKFFDLNAPVIGKTKRSDLVAQLKRSTTKEAMTLGAHKVWQGESRTLVLPSPKVYGSIYEPIAINMREETNRINFTLRLHKSVWERVNIDDFEVKILSANGDYMHSGKVVKDAEQMSYPATFVSKDEHSLKLHYTLMRLESGNNSIIKVRNTKEEKTYISKDLISEILGKVPNLDLACLHDFDVDVEIRDCSTNNNLMVTIKINDYQLHSFMVELSNRY